jgi:hypothetical protein
MGVQRLAKEKPSMAETPELVEAEKELTDAEKDLANVVSL